MDEYSRHLLQEQVDADTVHLEAHLPGSLDLERLRAAFARALDGHPRLRVRQSDSRWWHRRYHWEPAAPGPGAVTAAADPDRARRLALADPPPLAAGPPLRLQAAPAPGGGTVLVLAAAHTLADAGSCLRLLCDLAEQYSGAAVPAPAAPASVVGIRGVGQGLRPAPGFAGRPARIAPTAHLAPAPGTGVHLSVLPLPAPPVPRAGSTWPRVTVNDLLLTAVRLTLAEWNRRHGRQDRPIHLSMPVDDRLDGPLASGAAMGNQNHLATIRDQPPHPAPPPGTTGAADTALRQISSQTRAAKAARTDGPGLTAALVSAPWLPVGVKAPLTRALRRAAAPWTSTALVSNLGRVDHPLDFGPAGQAMALWFSAPVRMPRGLSVSALTLNGRLHLAVRHCHQLLDQAAAAEIAQSCAEALDALSAQGQAR
ncbi:condensation protein [Kitasatospora sp. NPDC048365]|uniref:condensation protein n=1 Tax=Kitasatospora sp. NPDC048365 TaxID=3364050 RepID=UPI00371CA864